MITRASQPVKLWGRGQLTIPQAFRRALKLDEHTVLNVFAVGQCLILTPKKLVGSSLRQKMQQAMKAEGLTLDGVLKSLKEERRRYLKEEYGLFTRLPRAPF